MLWIKLWIKIWGAWNILYCLSAHVFWGGNLFLFWIRSGFAWIFISLGFSFCFHPVTSACRMKSHSFPHDIRVWRLTFVIPHLEEKGVHKVKQGKTESGNSQDKMKNDGVRPWLPTTLQGSRVFVRVSRVTGSSEYFCQHAKTSFSGGSEGHSYLLQKLGEQMRECSFPYLYVNSSHRQQCSRWFCEVRRGNAEETLAYVAFVKRHRGMLSLRHCKYNDIYFSCNQSVKISNFWSVYKNHTSCHCRVVLQPCYRRIRVI